jgi:hypothetical protein
MKRTFLSLLLIALIGFSFAGNDKTKETPTAAPATITVTGNVVDMVTGEALTGVEILVEGTNTKVYSDFDGNFTISNVKPGEYNIVASFISYKKSLVEDFKADGSKSIDIKLQTD